MANRSGRGNEDITWFLAGEIVPAAFPAQITGFAQQSQLLFEPAVEFGQSGEGGHRSMCRLIPFHPELSSGFNAGLENILDIEQRLLFGGQGMGGEQRYPGLDQC